MNEITLSRDIITITAEINSYKQVAGQAVIEIGKRLKHIKENDLSRGKYIEWLISVDIDRFTAAKMIQAFEQFSNVQTSQHLPTGKIFEMLSLPESIDRQEFITQPHTIPSTGVEKTVDEMTVKELREVKKLLKEKEELLESTKSSADHWQKVAKSAQNIPPRIETRTVEVTPPDYADLQKQAAVAQQLNSENVQLKRASESMRQNYEDKLSEQKKQDSVKKDLQKYLSEQLRAITMNHDSAIFNFTEVQGDREAYDIVMRYLNQYESIIKQQFSEWEQLTSIRAVK